MLRRFIYAMCFVLIGELVIAVALGNYFAGRACLFMIILIRLMFWIEDNFVA